MLSSLTVRLYVAACTTTKHNGESLYTYDNYSEYKLHTVTNRTGMDLAYQLTTVNVYDGDPVPYLFKQLRRYSIQLALGGVIYDAQEIQRQAH